MDEIFKAILGTILTVMLLGVIVNLIGKDKIKH